MLLANRFDLIVLIVTRPRVCTERFEVTYAGRTDIIGTGFSNAKVCGKDEICFLGLRVTSTQATWHEPIAVPASYSGSYRYVSRGCFHKEKCSSLCPDTNATQFRGTLDTCNVLCCDTDFCNSGVYRKIPKVATVVTFGFSSG